MQTAQRRHVLNYIKFRTRTANLISKFVAADVNGGTENAAAS